MLRWTPFILLALIAVLDRSCTYDEGYQAGVYVRTAVMGGH